MQMKSRFFGGGAPEAASKLHDEVGEAPPKKGVDYDDRGSIVSVTERAQQAAKQFFNAGYQAIAPSDDLQQDTRDLTAAVGTQIDRASAYLKLESMTHANIVFTVALLYFAALMSLMGAIAVAVLTSQSSVSLNSAMACFAVEGLSRTIAVLLIVFLTFFFSFRIFRHIQINRDAKILPEQLLLIVFLVLIMVTPGMSVFSPYLFWKQFSDAYAFATRPIPDEVSRGQVFTIYFFSASDHIKNLKKVTSIFTILTLNFGFLFFGLSLHFFGNPVANLQRHPKSEREISEADETKPNAKGTRCFEALTSCLSDYQRMFLAADIRLLMLTSVYLIVSLVLILVYDYLPSQVPLVGMISVLKVCPQKPDYHFSNASTNCDPTNIGGVAFARAMSVTTQFLLEVAIFYYLHRITLRTKANLKRMPYEANRSSHLGFRYFNSNKRMTFFFGILGSVIVVATMGTDLETYAVSLTSDRVSAYSPLVQVGINFFGLGFGPFYLLLACFLFSLARAYLPPDSRSGLRGFCFGGGEEATVDIDTSHPVYIIRESDVALLRRYRDEAYEKMMLERSRQERRRVFLEASRTARSVPRGLRMPLFPRRPGDAVRGDRSPATPAGNTDPESREQDPNVNSVGDTPATGVTDRTEMFGRKQNNAHGAQRDKYMERYAHFVALLRPKRLVDPNEVGEQDVSLIAQQMNANLFCMETEVLMMNLSFIAYCFGGFGDAVPLSKEEKQAVLGAESRYRLIAHVENAVTDIQACILIDLEDVQRIYVTFRGTSTSKNIWQDLDYAQISAKYASDIEPLVPNADDVVAKGAAMRPPRVHRGFRLAYESISQAVFGVVSDLVDARSEGGCVVFACGHSLGGALATHFALDLGIKYPATTSHLKAIQVSTFGSPRVGNYSYVCRHARVVPTTHRFCIGGDPVPKLPPARPFGEFTKWGYHHIGVEILLDVSKVNLLVGPLFIERQIQHGWGGYVPRNHVTGSYVLALALWCARVHPTFTPDWWLPVINHILKAERVRLKAAFEVKPQLALPMADQLYKEGAIIWLDDQRSMQSRGCDTSNPTSQHPLTAHGSAHQIGGTQQSPSLDVEHTIASCGVLFKRQERALFLVKCGMTSGILIGKLQMGQWERLKEDSEGLIDSDFVKLVSSSMSQFRCCDCGFAPLVCPRCTESKLDMV